MYFLGNPCSISPCFLLTPSSLRFRIYGGLVVRTGQEVVWTKSWRLEVDREIRGQLKAAGYISIGSLRARLLRNQIYVLPDKSSYGSFSP